MMEVIGNSEFHARSKFVFAKSAIFAVIGQIQQGAIKYENISTF